MENSTQATSGALYGLAQELIRGFGPKRRFSQQLEPGRDKPRFNDPDAGRHFEKSSGN
jgi:hypothetical protein